jgi:integrase
MKARPCPDTEFRIKSVSREGEAVDHPRGLESYRGRWRWRRILRGEETTVYLKAESEAEAVEQAIVLNVQRRNGTLPQAVPRQRVCQFVKFMRDWLEHRPVSCGTRRRYRAMIETVEYWLNERGRADISIGSVNYNLMADYFRDRSTRLIIPNEERDFTRKFPEQGASKATLNCERAFLRSIFLEAMRRGYLEKNPLNGISCPHPRLQEWAVKHHPLKADEAERFLKAAYALSRDFGDVATVAVYTGMRSGELRALEWSAVDFETRLIKVFPKMGWKPKGTAGMVPMCQRVVEVLQSRSRDSEYVFAQERQRGSGLRVVNKGEWLALTKKAAVAAGLTPQLRFHDLRHSCATMLRAAGVNLETIQLILRHHDLRMTMLYAAPSYEELLSAVERIGVSQQPQFRIAR